MKAIWRRMSDWRVSLILLGVYAAILATATFVETSKGTTFVQNAIYHSWWFVALHVFLIVNFIAVSMKNRVFQRERWDVILIHYGLIIILAGALVSHVWGYEGLMHIREGQSSDIIVLKNKELKKVPFSVRLERFTVERYKWSHTPSSYTSSVAISHRGKSVGQDIFMNRIARVGGFRIYQTSYDEDERGTVLTVNFDRWGTNITYFGYFALFAGLLLSLLKKNGRFRTLYSSFGKKSAAIVFFLITLPFLAAEAKPARVVDAAHAEKFSKLLVQSQSGRIVPVNTYSSELLRKITRKDTYRGLTPDQVLTGIISSPELWVDEPLIYMSSKEVGSEIGIDAKYATFSEMFDRDGKYILADRMDVIARRPPAERTKTEKEYLKLDEKVNILYALFHGEMLPVFPVGDGHWLSSGSDTGGLYAKDSLVVSRTMDWYADAVRAGDYAEADRVVGIIDKYQKAKTEEKQIDQGKINAELLYNKMNVFRWAFRLYLVLGFALTLAALTAKKAGLSIIIAMAIGCVFLFHTFGIGLRWYIAGHAPWSNAYESMVHVAWTAVFAGLIFAKRSYGALGLATLLGGVILFVSNLNWLDPQITLLVPVLKSPWLMAHVSVITASYGFFGICTVCGMTSLTGMAVGRNFKDLRRINEMSMHIGLVLLTLGVFFGAIWANESWGRYWGWDPKETWALVTIIVYAFITHSRFVPKLNNPYAFDVMSVVAILSVLMTFFGVNYFLSGLHSYGNSGEISAYPILFAMIPILILFILAGCKYHKQILRVCLEDCIIK